MSGFDFVISIAIEPPPMNGSLYSDIILGYHCDRVLIAFDLPPGYLNGVLRDLIDVTIS
jgi:hypothetical protein